MPIEAAGGGGRALAGLRRDRAPGARPARPAGRPSSISCAAGTSRISNAFTKMRRCARPICCSSCRSRATYPSRERFLTELTLDPPEATSDRAGEPLLDEDYLILSTIHSAKGQEWKSVHLLNAVDGCLPSDLATGKSAEIEEERRLLYVAMTRARDHLHVIVPQRFFVHGQRVNGDRHLYASRTRFIPAGLLEHFECCGWSPAASAHAPPRAARPPVDVLTRVRDSWG